MLTDSFSDNFCWLQSYTSRWRQMSILCVKKFFVPKGTLSSHDFPLRLHYSPLLCALPLLNVLHFFHMDLCHCWPCTSVITGGDLVRNMVRMVSWTCVMAVIVSPQEQVLMKSHLGQGLVCPSRPFSKL